ncbi:hypothetical protein LDENG_00107100, partial [Lucifuga dentata]
ARFTSEREREFRDRIDPLAFSDNVLCECYRFSAEGIRYANLTSRTGPEPCTYSSANCFIYLYIYKMKLAQTVLYIYTYIK